MLSPRSLHRSGEGTEYVSGCAVERQKRVALRAASAARILAQQVGWPVEMLASEHRLRAMKEELELHQQCEELRLRLFSDATLVPISGCGLPRKIRRGHWSKLHL
jgi:hypothetical protein